MSPYIKMPSVLYIINAIPTPLCVIIRAFEQCLVKHTMTYEIHYLLAYVCINTATFSRLNHHLPQKYSANMKQVQK